jgi:hypothetical protein
MMERRHFRLPNLRWNDNQLDITETDWEVVNVIDVVQEANK